MASTSVILDATVGFIGSTAALIAGCTLLALFSPIVIAYMLYVALVLNRAPQMASVVCDQKP